MNIAADGVVYPCCVVHPHLVVGSLASETLDAVIAGSRLVQLKRSLLQGEIQQLPCAECTNARLVPVAEFEANLRTRYASEIQALRETGALPPVSPDPGTWREDGFYRRPRPSRRPLLQRLLSLLFSRWR